MESADHKLFIKIAEEDYKKIGHIKCPAFANKKVYFNKIGFNHLLWKGKKMRAPKEQIRRIGLISKALEIISTSREWNDYREITRILPNGHVSLARFWSFDLKTKCEYIKIIIRQTNNGKKYFLSVM